MREELFLREDLNARGKIKSVTTVNVFLVKFNIIPMTVGCNIATRAEGITQPTKKARPNANHLFRHPYQPLAGQKPSLLF